LPKKLRKAGLFGQGQGVTYQFFARQHEVLIPLRCLDIQFDDAVATAGGEHGQQLLVKRLLGLGRGPRIASTQSDAPPGDTVEQRSQPDMQSQPGQGPRLDYLQLVTAQVDRRERQRVTINLDDDRLPGPR
jgi:hypothetical protein